MKTFLRIIFYLIFVFMLLQLTLSQNTKFSILHCKFTCIYYAVKLSCFHLEVRKISTFIFFFPFLLFAIFFPSFALALVFWDASYFSNPLSQKFIQKVFFYYYFCEILQKIFAFPIFTSFVFFRFSSLAIFSFIVKRKHGIDSKSRNAYCVWI